jgi:integrase
MARNNEGWIRKRQYADGMAWLYCYQTTRASDGKRVEHTKRIGFVCDLPSEKAAWMEVARLSLNNNLDSPMGSKPTFGQIAGHFKCHELRKEGVIGKKAEETAARDKHNLDEYAIPRWGNHVAMQIKPLDLELWFESLNDRLAWPTIAKIRSVMSQVYKHAQRHGLLPQGSFPVQVARCKTTSDYEAKVVAPEQTVAILHALDTPETRLQWTLVLLHAATALRPEEAFGLMWSDVDWARGQINIRRAWSKGKLTAGKTDGSMTQVPMHPALAESMKRWQQRSPYCRQADWVFASPAMKGKVPLTASTCAKRYLRPAAVTAGVLAADGNCRFGWHNLRHSLATFLAANVDLKTAQTMLRHKRIATTAEIYAHAVQSSQIAAQGQYLQALKMATRMVQ